VQNLTVFISIKLFQIVKIERAARIDRKALDQIFEFT
jgi:hypothetical protein